MQTKIANVVDLIITLANVALKHVYFWQLWQQYIFQYVSQVAINVQFTQTKCFYIINDANITLILLNENKAVNQAMIAVA